jgi:AraC-like DNA-binding protein
MAMKANKASVSVHVDDVFFCQSNTILSAIECSDDFECKVLCLSDHIIQGLLHDKISLWNQAVYVSGLNVIRMSEICRNEVGLYYALIRSKIENHKDALPYEIVQAIVRALLLELCAILANRHGKAEEGKMSQGKMLFNRFLHLITSSDVKRRPINEYASQLAITPKYLTMLCLKYSDKTASDWIIQYTCEDIRFYLKNSNYSIKEISAKLGFANMSHFGSYVRKNLGLSPSEFRHRRE